MTAGPKAPRTAMVRRLNVLRTRRAELDAVIQALERYRRRQIAGIGGRESTVPRAAKQK